MPRKNTDWYSLKFSRREIQGLARMFKDQQIRDRLLAMHGSSDTARTCTALQKAINRIESQSVQIECGDARAAMKE